MEAEWQDIQGRMNSTENVTWGIKKRHENSQEKIKLKRFKEEKSISVIVWQDPLVASVGERHGGDDEEQSTKGSISDCHRDGSQSLCCCLTPDAQPGCRPSVPRTTDLILGTGPSQPRKLSLQVITGSVLSDLSGPTLEATTSMRMPCPPS